MSSPAFGQRKPEDTANDYTALAFVIQQMLNGLAGPTFVRVVQCSNNGQVAPPGTVNVQPLINQMTGNAQPQPHDVVYNLPYLRLMSGTNAVIMDPTVGDIGLACFGSRDLSAVKAFAQANPGAFVQPMNPASQRFWSWADGIYLFGVFGAAPTQYVQVNAQGINIVSPQQITLTAPKVTINASTGVAVNTPLASFSEDIAVANDMSVEGTTSGSGAATITGDLTVTGTTTGTGDGVFGGISVSTHIHPDPQGGNTGEPVP